MPSGPGSAGLQDVLAQLARETPEIGDLRLVRPIRENLASAVYEARLDDEQVIVKQFFGADAGTIVDALKAELDRLEEVFGSGRFQANRCLHAFPELGVAILSYAPGTRLDIVIAAATGQERAALLRDSGAWLRAYTAPRQRVRGFAPWAWVRKLRDMTRTKALTDRELGLLDRLLVALRAQAGQVKGQSFIQAATHGDYVGMNAHYHAGRIYGVDIQGESWMAIAKDAARFLVWQDIHDTTLATHGRLGLREGDVDAFLASGIVPTAERETIFPFFVGVELYIRLVQSGSMPNLVPRIRRLVQAYLEQMGGG